MHRQFADESLEVIRRFSWRIALGLALAFGLRLSPKSRGRFFWNSSLQRWIIELETPYFLRTSSIVVSRCKLSKTTFALNSGVYFFLLYSAILSPYLSGSFFLPYSLVKYSRYWTHFSGHGNYDWNDPLASNLLFANDERLSLEYLFAEAIPLPETSLVVLSACETNVTDPQDLADEYLGFASSFLFAGTPSVVSTLWAVDDLSTALLMMYFYQKYIKDGLHPSRALQAAQIWLRETVDRPFVMKFIESLLADIQTQHTRVSSPSEMADSIDRQRQVLQSKLKAMHRREDGDPGGRPFAHPYYWAAFTISGANLDRSPVLGRRRTA